MDVASTQPGVCGYKFPARKREDLLAVCDRLDAALGRYDITAKSSSRVALYRRVMSPTERVRIDAKDLPLGSLEAKYAWVNIELHELCLIVNQLGRNPAWRPKLRELLGGAPDFRKDKNHQARSTQFELYVAARFSQAGMTVSPAEPDILVQSDILTFGMAAKRVRSDAKFVQRVKEGCEQIREHQLPGIVAVDVSPLMPRPSKLMRVNSGEEATAYCHAFLMQFLVRHSARSFPPVPPDELPLCLLLRGTIAAWHHWTDRIELADSLVWLCDDVLPAKEIIPALSDRLVLVQQEPFRIA